MNGGMTRVERGRLTLEGLRGVIARPRSELDFVNEYQLIVAVVLSAQCTDERINGVTPRLFEVYPTFEALAEAEPAHVFPFIRSVSYPNNKSRHLVRMASQVRDVFGGRLPASQADLMKLAGVGRKTAQVVSSVAFNDEEALPVDTHVFPGCQSTRPGRASQYAAQGRAGAQGHFSPGTWGEAHHLLILHGRYTCTARAPKCDTCVLVRICRFGQALCKLPGPLDGLDARKGRFYCKTREHYFEEAATKRDRSGVRQVACPRCGSMNVFFSKSGKTAKKVRDFRVERIPAS